MALEKPLTPLPIDRHLPSVLAAFRRSSTVILQASPGSGKTTRVPPALLPLLPEKSKIAVLEPRRIAAKLAAYRVADEMGEAPGKTVGYQFRFERVASRETQILFLTEGMLLRQLISSPNLDEFAAVALDEFHERHLHGDIALAYLLHLQKTKRPDLKIIIMSATLETEALQKYLPEAELISVEAPRFPVQTHHLPSALSHRLEETVANSVSQALRDTGKGDILVFLPGMADIRRAEEAISRKGVSADIVPLHGELSVQDQTRAIRPGQRRKVILSTNVAESSVTIEGVTAVIDSGLHRQASHSWWSGIAALRTRPISRASAIQRAGRAGRTGPGHCYRLYTQGDFDTRAAFEKPEIQRADLTQTLLELVSLGIEDPKKLNWFEPPSPEGMASSLNLLKQLGLVQNGGDSSLGLTELGKRAVQLPLHPRLARFVLEAQSEGFARDAAPLAALLQEGDLPISTLSDLGSLLDDKATWRKDSRITRIADRVLQLLPPENKKPSKEALIQALLRGFPDRVAKRRAPAQRQGDERYATEVELLFCTGGSARVPNQPWLQESEFFLILEAREKSKLKQTQTELEITLMATLHPDWLLDLESPLLREKEELTWDPARKAVFASSQLRYGDIILSEQKSKAAQSENVLEILLTDGLGIHRDAVRNANISELLDLLRPKIEIENLALLLGRIEVLRQFRPELEIPPLNPQWILTVWAAGCEDASSLASFQATDPVAAITGSLDSKIAAALDRETPTHLNLPSGRRTRVFYSLGAKPWIESRLQDFFGLTVTPTLCSGRVPIVLHLLAPNQRPVQVTQDLVSFWKNTYPTVRKELSRRYPRHKWPEDPLAIVK